MAVEQVGAGSSLYNELLATQAGATAKNSEMSMDDFWKLLAAQLQYQDMSNPMDNSEMMAQMTQMATMNAMTDVSKAVSNFGVVTNNLAQVTLTGYSTGMIGREVTIAVPAEDGSIAEEITGIVTGVDLTGAQSVYVNGKKYALTQIMTVGKVPKKEEEKVPEEEENTGDETIEGTKPEEGSESTEGTESTKPEEDFEEPPAELPKEEAPEELTEA